MGNTIIVLGNGFDLDLGLKTSYNDFINEFYLNPDEKKREHTNTLINEILDVYENAGWIDIEAFLRKRAIDLSKDEIPKNRDIRCEYNKLCRDISSYMYADKYANNENKYNKDSCAYKIIPFIIKHNIPIFTFNYTDLSSVIGNMKYDDNCNEYLNITYIHGKSVNEWNSNLCPIIVGIDPIPVKDEFKCMIKAIHKLYKPGIISALNKSSNVIFFGIGFGITDFPYFKGFFNKVLKENKGDTKIFVFTKGDGSNFYYQISQMIGADDLPTFREKDITIYDTSDPNSFNKFEEKFNSTNKNI